MRTTIGLFCVSGVLVGIAGIVLLGRLGAGDPNGGVGLELQAIAAVVLGGASLSGGRGSVWGAVLGVILLGEIANSLAILGIQVFYQQMIYGAVLMVAVVATTLRERGFTETLRSTGIAAHVRLRRAASGSEEEPHRTAVDAEATKVAKPPS